MNHKLSGKYHMCSPPSFPLTLESNKFGSSHHIRYTIHILCAIYMLLLKPFISSSKFVSIISTWWSESKFTKIVLRSQGDQLYLQLATSRKWQNVQQFLKLSSTMFNVHWIINEVVFPCSVSIILIKQPYDKRCCMYLTSWLYISSHAVSTIGSSTIWRIPAPALPHPKPLPRSEAVSVLCYPPFWLSPPH